MATQLPTIVKGILSQRETLMKQGVSQKNAMRCALYIKELKQQVDAYQQMWNDEGWKNFVVRNTEKIIYLIPENKSGLTIKQKLYENL